MTYRMIFSVAALALFAGSAAAQNDPPLDGDGYPVFQLTNPITFDGVKTGDEWSEGKLQTWGINGEVPGVIWNTSNTEDLYTWGFTMLWDPTPKTGGLYIYGEADYTDSGTTPGFLNVDAGPQGGVAFGNPADSLNLYFSPNREFANSVAESGSPDGYQLGFNISGPDEALEPVTYDVSTLDNMAIYYEAHINGPWGNQGATKYGVNGGQAQVVTILDDFPPGGGPNDVGFQAVTHGTVDGWSYETFIPWDMMDGCQGGANDDGGGLCVSSLDLQPDRQALGYGADGTVAVGEEWYIDFGYYTTILDGDGNQTVVPRGSWAGSVGGAALFAQWPDPTMIFMGPSGLQCDLNGDGGVDAADAGIMFGVWGAVGPDTPADKNGDGFVDALDAGVMFSEWTGDLVPADPQSASAEYDPATGNLRMNVNGAVNVFVNSAGGLITPLAEDPAGVVGLLTNNKNRVGMTNLSPINVSDFSFGSIGGDIPMEDLTLVYSPRLGGAQVTVPFSGDAGAQAHYIPEPASIGMIVLGLAGLLAGRRRV